MYFVQQACAPIKTSFTFTAPLQIALRYLDKAGYVTVVANDGDEVIKIWKERGPFDVVLMDCQVCPDFAQLCQVLLLKCFVAAEASSQRFPIYDPRILPTRCPMWTALRRREPSVTWNTRGAWAAGKRPSWL